MLRSTARALAALVTAALLAVPAAASAASIEIHAHRGGSSVDGRPVFPEGGMPAFKAATRLGAVLELDVQLTRDGVPIVMHDDTLDRTTTCTGPVAERTAAQIRRDCRIDVLGSPDSELPWRSTRRRYRVPTLAQVLALARATRSTVNVELKQLDPSGRSARALAQVVRRSKLPLRRVIVQSFFPPNLESARAALPGVALSVLTIAPGNASGIENARLLGARWVSPQWPVDAAYVAAAHAAGLKVVPFTLDTDEAIRAAKTIGVDAVITDDPTMARWALR